MNPGHLEDGRLTIERAAKGRGVIGPTKTHRRRTITLGPAVDTRWVAHVDTWRPDAAAASWPFTSTPESDQALGLSGISLRFRRVRTIAGVTDATLHRLRHTVGTHLVRSGDLLGAKARLGHDNLSTTLRNYVDVDGIDDREAAAILDRLYNDEPPRLKDER